MFERFTVQARELVCVWTRQEAQALGHPHVGTEHLLLGLLHPEAGLSHDVLTGAGLSRERVRAEVRRLVGPTPPQLDEEDAAALRSVGIDLDRVIAKIEESFGPQALQPPPFQYRRGLFGRTTGPTRFTPRARKVLELSLREALRLKHGGIGTEHMLLGLVREGEGLAAKIITDSGVDLADLREATLAALRTPA
jgi:ATP-dependent Clp protease ATP-binding subunit ClpA